jgi:hypothetical protein
VRVSDVVVGKTKKLTATLDPRQAGRACKKEIWFLAWNTLGQSEGEPLGGNL